MDILNAFITDIYCSPLTLHTGLLMVCGLYKIICLYFGSREYQNNLWDFGVWLILLINPFLALLANNFWMIWLQTLILSVPLLLVGLSYSEKILNKRYNEGALMHMVGIYLFIMGQIASLVIYGGFRLFGLWNAS
jgi:hypothetical protein